MSLGLANSQALSSSHGPNFYVGQPPTLRPRACEVCGSRADGLERCGGCDIVYYCSAEHRDAHATGHEEARCSAVARARAHLRSEQRKLAAGHGAHAAHDPVAGGEFGRFWDVQATRGYMLARYVLVDTALRRFPAHRAAVEECLGHLLDMCRLSHSDNMGVRHIVPGLFLRLGRDQEAYDFMKRWAIIEAGRAGPTAHQNFALGADVSEADVFEAPSLWTVRCHSISHAAAVALIKVRVVNDLLVLQATARALRNTVPREILHQILRDCAWGSIVATRGGGGGGGPGGGGCFFSSADELGARAAALQAHVRALVAAVHAANRYFWGALCDGARDPGAARDRPGAPARGSVDEAEMMAGYGCWMWRETPGTLGVLRALEGSAFAYYAR